MSCSTTTGSEEVTRVFSPVLSSWRAVCSSGVWADWPQRAGSSRLSNHGGRSRIALFGNKRLERCAVTPSGGSIPIHLTQVRYRAAPHMNGWPHITCRHAPRCFQNFSSTHWVFLNSYYKRAKDLSMRLGRGAPANQSTRRGPGAFRVWPTKNEGELRISDDQEACASSSIRDEQQCNMITKQQCTRANSPRGQEGCVQAAVPGGPTGDG